MRRLTRSFRLALQFLTVIPVKVTWEITPRAMGQAMAWFSVVGLLIGGGLALGDVGLRRLLPPPLAAAALLLLWVGLSGVLHLDGFLDCCDGLLAAKPSQVRLEILRDTNVGAFAVVGAICLLLVKLAAILELAGPGRGAGLLVIPALTRAAMVYAAKVYPYARPGPGLGQLFREGLTWLEVCLAVVLAVAVAVALMGVVGLALAVAVWVTTTIGAWFAMRRIGGLTGDVYGALNEVAEVVALVCLVAIQTL